MQFSHWFQQGASEDGFALLAVFALCLCECVSILTLGVSLLSFCTRVWLTICGAGEMRFVYEMQIIIS